MSDSRKFSDLAAPGVRGLEPYLPGKPIEEIEREYGIKDSVKLASNENPLGPPLNAVEAIRSSAWTSHLYPDGGAHELKQALSETRDIDPGRITLTNGSNDALVLLAETFLEPGLEAIYDEFSFVVYRLAVQATGATARIAPSRPANAESQPRGHDLEAFAALLNDKTRLVYIANPNNPTGTWVGADELRAFLEAVPAHTIVVLDEAYAEYVTFRNYPDSRALCEEFPNLVVTRTFSKIFALAGLRIGYAISHPEIADLLNRVRQPFNVNRTGQLAAATALYDGEFVARSRHFNHSGREQLFNDLQGIGFRVTPSAANFLLVDTGGDATAIYEALLREGIIVRPVPNYGLPAHLRITVGLPEQNQKLTGALERIRGKPVLR